MVDAEAAFGRRKRAPGPAEIGASFGLCWLTDRAGISDALLCLACLWATRCAGLAFDRAACVVGQTDRQLS
jgi:hypothetical protein